MNIITKAFFTWVQICALILYGLFGCQSPDSRREGVIEISAVSSIPTIFDASDDRLKKIEEIILPEQSILLSRVTRPKANLRIGPGTQFELVDKSLSRSDLVYLFGRVGVWQKVYETKTAKGGWLHYQTIMEPWLNSAKIAIKIANLPKVFATNNIGHVYSFPDRQKAALKIPKGAMFNAVSVTDFGTLVWLHQNNSLMWIAGEVLK